MDEITIRIDTIYVPARLRQPPDPKDVEALAESIIEEGQRTAISVREDKNRYVLVSGRKRLEALKALGEETVRAVVVQAPKR